MDSLEQLTTQITTLRERGIALTDEQRYDEALALHQQATAIAERGVAQGLNPDWFALSSADEAYAIRQRTNNTERCRALLDKALLAVVENTTAFGRGRTLEEAALTYRYAEQVDGQAGNRLHDAAVLGGKAMEQYETALANEAAQEGTEILPHSAIQNRLFRTIGVTAAAYAELASTEPDRALASIRSAAGLAEREVALREQNGETEGFPLMNAYHTLGAVQTERLRHTGRGYDAAQSALARAQALAHDHPRPRAVLHLRRAALEYTRDEKDVDSITPHVDRFLQEAPVLAENKGVLDALKPLAERVSSVLDTERRTRLNELYTP